MSSIIGEGPAEEMGGGERDRGCENGRLGVGPLSAR